MIELPKRFSAGIVPYRLIKGEIHFLLLRAYQYWDFPKGGVMKDENAKDAALRELQEEAGLTDVTFPFGDEFIETAPYSNGKIARYYLAEVGSGDVVLGINPELGRPEHNEFRWMTYEEADQVVVPRVQLVLEWAHALWRKACKID